MFPMSTGSEYEMGTCLRMAGNGQEENRNNSYPHKVGCI